MNHSKSPSLPLAVSTLASFLGGIFSPSNIILPKEYEIFTSLPWSSHNRMIQELFKNILFICFERQALVLQQSAPSDSHAGLRIWLLAQWLSVFTAY